MNSKNDNSVVGKKYTFFESPLGNLERKIESEHAIKEPSVTYDPNFEFPAPYIDRVSMNSELISFENVKPNDKLRNTRIVWQPRDRNFENEKRIVEHYLTNKDYVMLNKGS